MRRLHIDAVSGAAGDMLLAALIDAGAEFAALHEQLSRLRLGGFSLAVENVTRGGISACHLLIDQPRAGKASAPRRLRDLLALADSAPFSSQVKQRAARVFRLLATAEGKVHGQDPETIHFHEISGVDTIIDVLGVCLALEMLAVERLTCSPLKVGSGTVRCAHGALPLPAPATLEILTRYEIPFAQTDIEAELLTPTGVALLAVLADSFGPMPAMAATRVGYGAGSRDLAGRPNVLRVLVGADAASVPGDQVTEFRTVIDDMTPEAVAYCLERCFAAGALEAYAVPATMKKNRLGFELTVLAPPAKAPAVQATLFRHSSTFGIRVQQVPRSVLTREFVTVEVAGTEVRVKVGRCQGELLALAPEFDDCRAVAESTSMPIGEVFKKAEHLALEQVNTS